MKNIIFFGLSIFIFFGVVHDFFLYTDFHRDIGFTSTSELIATFSTIILLAIIYVFNKPGPDIKKDNEFKVPKGFKTWDDYYKDKYSE